jgi:hypothetical protein
VNKHLFIKIVLLSLIGLAVPWGYGQYQISHPNREHVMTELTQTTHPYCVGRFLVNIPKQAKPGPISQRIMDMGEIEVSTAISKNQYLGMVEQKEAELRATPHKKEGTVLHEVWHPNGLDATVFFYRDDDLNTLDYSILAYLWDDKTLYIFNYGASNDKVEAAKNDLLRAFALIQPRDNNQIPTAPGTCIERAFVPGKGYRDEDIGLGLDIPEYPDAGIGLAIRSTDKPDTEGLLDMVDRHMKGINIQYPNLHVITLRRGSRTVSGMPGEELIQVLKGNKNDLNNPNDSFSAIWEFNGIAKSMTQPNVSFRMDYTISSDPKTPRLSQEQLLALWDTVVGSLRPRPGAF